MSHNTDPMWPLVRARCQLAGDLIGTIMSGVFMSLGLICWHRRNKVGLSLELGWQVFLCGASAGLVLCLAMLIIDVRQLFRSYK